MYCRIFLLFICRPAKWKNQLFRYFFYWVRGRLRKILNFPPHFVSNQVERFSETNSQKVTDAGSLIVVFTHCAFCIFPNIYLCAAKKGRLYIGNSFFQTISSRPISPIVQVPSPIVEYQTKIYFRQANYFSIFQSPVLSLHQGHYGPQGTNPTINSESMAPQQFSKNSY